MCDVKIYCISSKDAKAMHWGSAILDELELNKEIIIAAFRTIISLSQIASLSTCSSQS